MDKKKILLLSAGHASSDINSGALPAVLPFLQEAYALSYQATGGIMFALSMIAAITQPAFGLLSDRIGRPWLVPLGVLCAGLGLGLTGWVSSYAAVLCTVALCGLGTAIFHPTAARLANLFAGRNKGTALSLFSIGGNVGFVLGPLIAALLLPAFGLSGTLFFALLALVTAASLAWSVGHVDLGGSRGTRDRQTNLANNWRQFGRLTIAILATTVISFGLRTYIPLHWMDIFALSKTDGAMVITGFGFLCVICNMAGGWCADRIGMGRVLRISFVPLAPALFVLANTTSLLLAAAMLALLAFCLSFGFSSMIVLGQQFLARNIGFASGVTLGLSTAVGGICAPLVGWVGDTWGLATSFVCLAVLGLAATAAVFFVDVTANAAEEQSHA